MQIKNSSRQILTLSL